MIPRLDPCYMENEGPNISVGADFTNCNSAGHSEKFVDLIFGITSLQGEVFFSIEVVKVVKAVEE